PAHSIGLPCRKGHRESRATRRGVLNDDLPAVGTRDLSDNGQPEAEPYIPGPRLGPPVERVEDSLPVAGRDAIPGIVHDHDRRAIVILERDADMLPGDCELDRVVHEVANSRGEECLMARYHDLVR